MPLSRLLVPFAALAAAAALAAPAAAVSPAARTPDLQFLGQAIIPTGVTFAGTQVGGLSSIAFDPALGVYYVLSDARAQFGPVRFYTFRIDLDGSFDAADLHIERVTELQAPGGGHYTFPQIDPEGLTLTKDRQLVLTSEGDASQVPPVDPFVRLYGLDGSFEASLPVPSPFLPAPGKGVRTNLGFESAAVAPNGRFFFTATENALVQDGPPATVAAGSPSRLLRYNLQTGRLDRQYVYPTDPIFQPPVPPTNFAVNGIVELLPFNNELMLSMERSFSVGVPGTGNEIKLYRVALPGADDVNGFDSLAALLGSLRPVQKTLLLDLGTLGIPLDNVEGMTLGPTLPDGRRSLVMVSDNNFAASQFTQFLLFALGPG